MKLRDKITLITGASSGIGKACAYSFAAAGSDLILAARRVGRLEILADELLSEYAVRCLTVELDVRDKELVNDLVESLPDDFSEIDILINNAGLASGMDPIHDGDHEDWDVMIDTNVKGLLNLTRAIVPGMIIRECGHIINIGSIAGRQVYPNGGVYCATKFAVRALTQGLMIDLVNTPVRVSLVDPGMVETEFSTVRFHGDENRAMAVYDGLTPLTGDDVAEAVLFCATRPVYINVSEMVVLPADQASAYHVNRSGE